ncbi:hypothetical protein D3C72_774340 [compost metagenome]
MTVASIPATPPEWLAHPRGSIDVGDVLAALRYYPDNYFDAVLTDPPYGLSEPPDAEEMAAILAAWLTGQPYTPKGKGFMGKEWDAFVPGPEVWREVLRVMKPGAMLMAFAGSRTHDLMGLAIRLAGFEIRDGLMWLYGSGYPKSMALDKAIDKLDAVEARRERDLRFTAWLRSTGITSRQINEVTNSAMAAHYLSDKKQPAVPTADMMDLMRPLLPEVPDWVEAIVAERTIESENMKAREVLARVVGKDTTKARAGMPGQGNERREYDVTAPATPEASTWAGHGTALKPGHEPITLAMKPLDGTFAQNALRWGVAGLNIEGGRAGFASAATDETGRWPSNVHMDEATAAELDEQSGTLRTGAKKPGGIRDMGYTGSKGQIDKGQSASEGGASRFFYVAKPTRAERDAGLQEEPDRLRHRVNAGGLEHDPRWAPVVVKNDHPTVKPIGLTRQLATLLLPPARPGGEPRRILVPFAGSGSEMIGAALAGWEDVTGIEREPEYARTAAARLRHHTQEAP